MSLNIFIIVEVCVATFILSTTGNLPEHIASHFDGAGSPNAFMSQRGYVIFMLVFATGIPALVVGGIAAALRLAPNSINIPNREYWLAPERKPETIRFLTRHMAWLGTLFAGFIAYVHWLLMQANSVQPAQLSNKHLFLGMAVLLALIALWASFLSVRFMRIPKP